jgi:diguanylate cyclase (GGDEF)-like protein
MPLSVDLPPALSLVIGALAAGVLGAIVGAAAYAVLVGKGETRRLARLADRLMNATDARDLVRTAGIKDTRLRSSLGRLADRMTEAWTMATMDMLTGVLNRQALLARLDAELDRAARYGHQLSIILVDIDHFKRLNDTYGHVAGDQMLHAVAEVLRASVRGVDIVGRYGGEEFMAVLPETDVDAAASLAEKLRRFVALRSLALEDGSVVSVTLSAGVAGGFGGHLDLVTLVRDSDNALYSAKALGRDQVFVFRELQDDSFIKRAAIAPSARERAVEVGRAALGAATDSLTAALGDRAGWNGRPSSMIASAATELGRAVGLPERELERIRVASLLHDLGKLAIPEAILQKPSELDEPEWRVIAEHPKIGQVVLEQAGALRDAATIVLHHHEWYDGRGYPHGLSGEEIPIGARIVAIADAYEAMVAGRPYRSAISHSEAIAELRRHGGVQFDPELVDLFADLFATEMPFPVEAYGSLSTADHLHPHPEGSDERAHGEIHDALHDRRRRQVQPTPDPQLTPTGTGG